MVDVTGDASEEDSATAEFDVVAGWTADAVAELGQDHAVPGACRGSGSPAALEWIGHRLALDRGSRLLDCGAGTGGAAAFAAATFGATPLLAEPMIGACRAARRMFDLPVVTADGGRLPLASGWADAAWALGVLSTTTNPDSLLAEVHRALVPGGSLGLLVLVQVVDQLPEEPADNHFPTASGLEGSLHRAGFGVEVVRTLEGLPSPPEDWDRRARRVEEVVARDHGGDPRWITAEANTSTIGRLLDGGHLEVRLVHARRG